MKPVIRLLAIIALGALVLVPCAQAEEKKPAPAPPIPTHSPSLDSFEELVWANRDKLDRWCLTCLGFHGWKGEVEFFRRRLAESDIDSEIWNAREALLKEVKENQLQAYVDGVEARTTDNLAYKKVNAWDEPEGLQTLEFRVTERDETGSVTSIHYELHTVRYDRRAREWTSVARRKSERSERQKQWEEVRNKARGK
jgi:hypothetical protein